MDKTNNQFDEVIAKSRKGLRYVFFFSLFVNLLMLTVPLFMLLVFDYVLSSQSGHTLIFLIIIAIFALIIMSSLDILRGFVMRRIAFWFEDCLNTDALKKSADELLQGKPYGTQSLSDIASLRFFLSSPSIFSLFDVPWMPIYIAVIFLLNPILGWFALAGAIVLIIMGYINEFISKDLLREGNTQAILNQKKIDVAMRNVEVIQAMGMMDNIASRWKKSNNPAVALQQVASDRTGLIASISKFFRLFLQLGVLAIGAYLVINDNLTPGGMIAASILLSRALAPAEQSITVWKQLVNARQAFERLKNHFLIPGQRGTGIKLPAPIGNLVIEHLLYEIEGVSQPIIKDISFTLSSGEILALVGPSGAGKTTLARLITGIIKPTKGSVRLDGAEVYQWDRSDFGQHVGYIPQDIELFPGTIKENIARMGDIDDDKVLEAAILAGAHEFILKQPKAYDTEITITSNPLSGGQRQRIALARAFYGLPKLIVLDEPNSSLDSDGEQILYAALIQLKEKECTVIIITHHMPALLLVDKVAVIASGQLVKIGPRENILRSTHGPQEVDKNNSEKSTGVVENKSRKNTEMVKKTYAQGPGYSASNKKNS